MNFYFPIWLLIDCRSNIQILSVKERVALLQTVYRTGAKAVMKEQVYCEAPLFLRIKRKGFLYNILN